MTANHGRRGRPWRRLRAQVLAEERVCWMCGRPATCVDHVKPLSKYPELAHVRSNLRASCRRCNLRKGDRPAKRRPIVVTTEVTRLQW